MSEFLCPEPCDTCPLRTRIGGTPDVIVEIGYEVPGRVENFSNNRGGVASFEFNNGIPSNHDERTSSIALIDNDTGMGIRIVAPGRLLDDGTIQKNIRDCEGPTEKRGGFLWLRKRLACTALNGFKT